MNILFSAQHEITPPPIALFNWGRAGRGQMHKRTTPKIFKRAKELRRDMTPVERKLHAHLRAHRMGGVHFRPQHAIGNYIVDFCAPRKKLIIELDGSQHLEQKEYDAERTKYFEARGYRVLRFWNNAVMKDMETVLKIIWGVLRENN
jgi:very-short-patch-repair endonuclease